jgi:hypothetical protein
MTMPFTAVPEIFEAASKLLKAAPQKRNKAVIH